MGKGTLLIEAKGSERKNKKTIRTKASKSKILRTMIRNDREWQYHATKGWRSYRLEAAE